jgi:hypothetical protein
VRAEGTTQGATSGEGEVMSDHGFTNSAEDLERVRQFRDAAVADGWAIAPTYGEHESVDRAAKLHKDGFTMMILTRSPASGPKWKYEAQVSLWGPDGMGILVPEQYDWSAIQDAIHLCGNCKKRVEKTHRYSFAGRCCEECLPEMRKKHEYPGWCD